jgi:probable HAF family extracellular repeat protein
MTARGWPLSQVPPFFVLVFAALSLLGIGLINAANADTYAFTDLGTVGGDASYAYGINNAGQVVGWSATAGNAAAQDAVIWNSTAPTILGTLGGTTSRATGRSINNPTFTRRIEEKASERRSGFSVEFFASCAWTKRPCF